MNRQKRVALMMGLIILGMILLISCRESESPAEQYIVQEDFGFSYENATVYFVMTDRYLDGDPTNNNSYGRVGEDALGTSIATFHGGDFVGLTEKLEEGYFSELGVNVLWVSAPYEQIHGYIGGGSRGDFAHYGFHGYYALDWTMMDRNFGTVEEFRKFVNTAHEQGIRVFLDVVMNHVGYPTLRDMVDFGFGGATISPEEAKPSEGENFHKWTEFVDWESKEAWGNWWGDWVRADLPGYHPPGETVYTQTLYGLPDIRTEVEEDLGLPPILIKKWEQEESPEYDPWIVPSAKELRKDLGLSPAEYIIEWLAAWVEEFGINGFRIDTAKHVEIQRWEELKERTNEALRIFRESHPELAGAKFEEDFFFLGEVWGHGLNRNYYYDRGFDALINFTFQGERRDGPAYFPERMPRIFENYSQAINGVEDFTTLSYLSQHDTSLYPRERLEEGGTYLMLLPGMVKIFYGDETAREVGAGGSDATMGTRSPMNWETMDEELLQHFQKLGQFRKRNISIGAGSHYTHNGDPFIFSRSYQKGDRENSVIVYIGDPGNAILPTGEVFQEEGMLRDAYSGKIYEYNGENIEIEVGDKGIALMEAIMKLEEEE